MPHPPATVLQQPLPAPDQASFTAHITIREDGEQDAFDVAVKGYTDPNGVVTAGSGEEDVEYCVINLYVVRGCGILLSALPLTLAAPALETYSATCGTFHPRRQQTLF